MLFPSHEKARDDLEKEPGTVRRVHGHTCPLPIEDDLITLHINAGPFVLLRRKWRLLLLVHPAHPRAADFYCSTTQFRLERARHLHQYYEAIHPFSMGRFWFECVTIFVYLAQFHVIPLFCCLMTPPKMLWSLRQALDIFTYADIVLLFYTGYVDKKKNMVVLCRRDVVKHYLKGYFIVDLLSVMPVWTILYLAGREEVMAVRLVYVSKLMRLPTLMTYMQNFFQYMKFRKRTLEFLHLSLYLWIFLFWFVIIGFIVICNEFKIPLSLEIPTQGRKELLYKYLSSFYVTARAFLLVSVVPYNLHSDIGQFYKFITTTIGAILTFVIYVQVYKIVQRRSGARKHFDDTIVEMEEFMHYKELEPNLKDKILAYLNFRYDRNIVTHEKVAENVSTIIQNDILRHNYRDLFRQVSFFNDLTDQMMLALMRKMRQEVFFNGDVIIKAGTPATCMYFVKHGIVAMYTSKNIEMSHLEDGACISEYSLIVDAVLHQVTCVAVQNSTLIRLSRKDFLDVMQLYPGALDAIRSLGLGRLLHLKRQFMRVSTTTTS